MPGTQAFDSKLTHPKTRHSRGNNDPQLRKSVAGLHLRWSLCGSVENGSHYRLVCNLRSSYLSLSRAKIIGPVPPGPDDSIFQQSVFPAKSDMTKWNRNTYKSHQIHQSVGRFGRPENCLWLEPHKHPKHQYDFYLQPEKNLTLFWTA